MVLMTEDRGNLLESDANELEVLEFKGCKEYYGISNISPGKPPCNRRNT